jgi:hypothetical protein
MKEVTMSRSTYSHGLAAVVALAGTLGLAGPAFAQPLPPPPPVLPAPPPPVLPAPPVLRIVPAPPAVFIATTSPVYYEGHATYWYGDHWVWRDGRAWHPYEHEPEFLHERRVHREPHRRWHYEHHRR